METLRAPERLAAYPGFRIRGYRGLLLEDRRFEIRDLGLISNLESRISNNYVSSRDCRQTECRKINAV
jgi:hypothetical protein